MNAVDASCLASAEPAEEDDFGTIRPKPGDVWQLGNHLLICGDCTDPRIFEGLEPFDLLWTDPPYGVNYVGKTTAQLKIENDKASQLPALLDGAFAAVSPHLKPGASFYVCHSAGPNQHYFSSAIMKIGWKWHQSLAWVKHSFVFGRSDYHYRHEHIIYGWKPGAAHTWLGGRKQDSVLLFPKPNRNAMHPTMKPLELVELCIRNSTHPGGRVVDLFGGSGTLLIACESLGRVAVIVEISPRYCEVILRRWEDLTGLGGFRRVSM